MDCELVKCVEAREQIRQGDSTQVSLAVEQRVVAAAHAARLLAELWRARLLRLHVLLHASQLHLLVVRDPDPLALAAIVVHRGQAG